MRSNLRATDRLRMQAHRCLLVAVLVLLPTIVSAQSTKSNTVRVSSEYLQRMDTDGNGKVSVLEYQDWLSYAFDGMDRNHDGLLSPDEQPGGRGQPLTRDAHRARLADTFKRQDRNHDGVLDAKELAAPPQVK